MPTSPSNIVRLCGVSGGMNSMRVDSPGFRKKCKGTKCSLSNAMRSDFKKMPMLISGVTCATVVRLGARDTGWLARATMSFTGPFGDSMFT